MASRTRNFFLNALSLTITALLMRGIAVIFNAYVSKEAGSEAMGLYSLIISVYAFSITVATASINLGTTRIVADALGLDDIELARRSATKALLVSLITSSIATIILFFLAPFISSKILGDARATTPLKILSVSLIPVSVCSCLSGYFTAVRRVKVNSAFQIVAQFAKIGITVYFLSFFVDKSTEMACNALVIGSTAAEFISLAINYTLYRIDVKKKLLSSLKAGAITSISYGHITGKLLKITLPVTLSACIRSALSMFQHVLIPKGLATSGSSWTEALSSYGALHGMAMPLILFPSAFVYSFAGLLIPEVSEYCIRKDIDRLSRVSYRAVTLSLFFSIGVAGIMIFFSNELGMLVYNNAETAKYIRIMAPLIPVMYIDGTVDAVLKGSGHQVYSMNVNIVDALTACIFALVLIPKLGIWGYIISIYATEIMNTSLSLLKLISVAKIKAKLFHQVVMPLLCIVGATNLSRLALIRLNIAANSPISLTLNIFITSALYIILLLLTRTIGRDESEFLNASLLTEKQYTRRFDSQKNKILQA